MNAEAINDADLVQRFNSGDESAFLEIMSRHQSRIFAAAMGLLHNQGGRRGDHPGHVRARPPGSLQVPGDSSLATWLHRIAVNLARNRYWYFFRRCRGAMLSLDAEMGDDGDSRFSDICSASEPDPSQEYSRSEFMDAVERAMEKLEPAYRRILAMRSVLDQSYEEIAAALGINVGTVKSRIARARERLRKRLAEECPDFARESDPAEWFEPARGAGHATPAGC